MKISVSYLKSNYLPIETIEKINKTSADYLHVDLMDGIFVPERNFQIEETISTLKNKAKPLDIHLMVQNPLIYIDDLATLKPDIITIHIEANNTIESILLIKKHHIKVGLALSPDTDLKELEQYYPLIDLVLVMSVEPGAGGQKFMPKTIKRLQELKEAQQKHRFLINVDGGINNKTIKLIKEYCDIVVSGSYICLANDFEKQITSLKN